jgi:hypothetical protein
MEREVHTHIGEKGLNESWKTIRRRRMRHLQLTEEPMECQAIKIAPHTKKVSDNSRLRMSSIGTGIPLGPSERPVGEKTNPNKAWLDHAAGTSLAQPSLMKKSFVK